jgi:hypothetical protein
MGHQDHRQAPGRGHLVDGPVDPDHVGQAGPAEQAPDLAANGRSSRTVLPGTVASTAQVENQLPGALVIASDGRWKCGE